MHTTKTPATTYTFSVTVTAPEADDDGNGYTRADVEELLKRTLGYYAAPLNKERHWLTTDWELLEVERPTCGGCGLTWLGEGPAPTYCAHCDEARAQAARADSFDAMDARIAAECRQDAWDAD